MIVSVSRRTDIPALYADWFYSRLRAGEVLVRNPLFPAKVRHVSLAREDVDGFVFWTKNPEPFLSRLDQLDGYPYYFLFTLNPYGGDMEAGLPSEQERVDVFRRLVDRVGAERVLWRYDPVVLTPRYTETFHLEAFGKLAGALRGYTADCKMSFLCLYPKIRKAMRAVGSVEADTDLKHRLGTSFLGMAEAAGIRLGACCDEDLLDVGYAPAACVDAERMGRIAGKTLPRRKDPGQRKECSCSLSADIGAYNTCPHGCAYCYANYSVENARKNYLRHTPESSFLVE